jgi:peptidyl-prolyl cis-trans isomerase B (cyclophilin B)
MEGAHVASKRDRQRKLERARTERRIARQAQKVRQRRQVQAIVGASVVLILVILGVIFILKPFSSGNKPQAGGCVWKPIDTATDPNVVDVGTPPTSGMPTTGSETMTIGTNLGDIVITLNLDNAPCAAASFSYLGSKGFFNNSSCSALDAELETLQCGDPKSNGTGGPAYQFADEYIPQTPLSASPSASTSASPSPSPSGQPSYYPKGQVVLVNTGANTNGSQFYIITGDHSPLSNANTVIGDVTSGMDIVDKVVQAGAVDSAGKPTTQGKPNTTLTFQSLTVSAGSSASASPTVTPTTAPA